MAIITIGREFGSGGRLIGRALAERLSLPFYDKSVIEMAARESGLAESFIRKVEEQRSTSFLYNMVYNSQNLSLLDQVYIAEANVIRNLADQGDCVIVGRCADYVLRDHPHCCHVFIHAPLEDRVRRAQERYKVTAPDVGAYVQKQDKLRASYYQQVTSRRWGRCQNYDLSVNSALGVELLVDLMARLLQGQS